MKVENTPQKTWRRRIFWHIFWLVLLLSMSGDILLSYKAQAAEGLSRIVSAQETTIHKVLIEVEDFPGEKDYWADLARDLIVVRAGEVFSAERIEASIGALKQSRLFRNIHLESLAETGAGHHTVLLFRLTPFHLIKDIRLEGAVPLFEKEVLTAMTVYVGDTFTEEKLANQESVIKNLFVQAGFPNPRVELTAIEDPNDGHVVVDVAILKGHYQRLQNLTLDGNRAFSTNRLKWKMTSWRVKALPGSLGRFVESDLKKDIEKLVAFYRKTGFADAAIHYEFHKDPNVKDPGALGPSVSVKIEEGRRYPVRISGDKRFWGRTLEKDVVLFTEGNKNGLGLKKSVKKIKERYRKAGYLAAEVTISEKVSGDRDVETRRIDLVVNEGPCSRVQSIVLVGNQALSSEEIQKQMLSRPAGRFKKGIFVPEILSEDLYAIKALYAKHGYMNAKVLDQVDWSSDRRRVTISITIHEGVRTTVASTRIVGLTVLPEKEAYEKIRLKDQGPFRKHMIQSDENALSALISEKGYPHVYVVGEASFSEDGSKAFVTYTIKEGPFVKAGQVCYQGNFRTKRNVIDREFQMVGGEAFSLKQMLEGQRKIRNLDLFDSVKLRAIGLKEKREEVDLVVEVEEKKPFFLEMGGGYESQKGFFLQSKVGDHNFMGTNKDLWLGAETSEVGYRVESRMEEPRLFGSRISAGGGFFWERIEEFNKDFGTDTYGSSIGFRRAWSSHLATGLSLRYERREQFIRNGIVPPEETTAFEPRSILVTTPSIRYDTRDSFLRPKTGILSQLSVDISRGLTNELDNFLKYRFDFRCYVTPLSRLTLAWVARGGYLDPYGATDTVPEDQLFFLGGTSDVRGFDENLLCFEAGGDPLGGRSQLSGSIEARIDLGGSFELPLFYDIGRIGKALVDHDTADEFRSSVGIGLRYITPIGPVGILYGRKLDPVNGESSGQFHFTIGYTF